MSVNAVYIFLFLEVQFLVMIHKPFQKSRIYLFITNLTAEYFKRHPKMSLLRQEIEYKVQNKNSG
jgi:hypothetical protein